MAFSTAESSLAHIVGVSVSDDTLSVDLSDGRTIATQLPWFPRLLQADRTERDNWRLIGHGDGINWPDLDEDISLSSLLAGRSSAESQESLQQWFAGRARKPTSE